MSYVFIKSVAIGIQFNVTGVLNAAICALKCKRYYIVLLELLTFVIVGRTLEPFSKARCMITAPVKQ